MIPYPSSSTHLRDVLHGEDDRRVCDDAFHRGSCTGSGHAETVSGVARDVLWDDLLYYSGAFCLLYSQRPCFGRRLMLATGSLYCSLITYSNRRAYSAVTFEDERLMWVHLED